MRRVKSRDTTPERKVRSLLHLLGYRFRLHRKDMPGKPDIILPRYRTVIFVHGCFWHRHAGCPRAAMPQTRTAYWTRKLERNATRDAENQQVLTSQGWRVIVVWECELRDRERLATRLRAALSNQYKNVPQPEPFRLSLAADHCAEYCKNGVPLPNEKGRKPTSK